MIKAYLSKLPQKKGNKKTTEIKEDILAFVESGNKIAEIEPRRGNPHTTVSTYFQAAKRLAESSNLPYGVEVKARLRGDRVFLERIDYR